MPALGAVKARALRQFTSGDPLGALRLYDAAVASAPLDYESRLGVADCLAALGDTSRAVAVYLAVADYTLRAGHPMVAIVAARVVESFGAPAGELWSALVAEYGSGSPRIGKFAGRINLPAADTEVSAPPAAAGADFLAVAASRAVRATDGFDEYPAAVHPIPLLSELGDRSLRRVLGTIVVRRLPDGTPIIRQGDPGESFYFVATGEVRVFATDAEDPGGGERELARLHEGAVFGEMALVSAQPRTASVTVAGSADLLEFTRASLATLANDLAPLATALNRFMQERMLGNLTATHPLFRPFSEMQRRDLLRRFTSYDLAPGDTVIRQGEEGRGLFVLLLGEVVVTRDGAAQPVATLSAGSVVGELALLRRQPTSATVTATRPTTVLFLAREYVDKIAAAVPAVRSYLEALAEGRELDLKLADMGGPADAPILL